MIMTAELNSHQRVSYYTGVKLIRHNQSASTANPNNNNNTTTNNNSNTPATPNSNTASGGFYNHHNHFPPQPPHNHHHHHHNPHPHHPQQQHPPLPPHHPGHFHLQCPTGPPQVLHLNNHHGPPYHPQQPHNGNHHYGSGGGSNQTTRLYTGSPLIRSTGYHSSSVSGGSGGATGLGSNKRSFKGHHHRNNLSHHNSLINNRSGGIGNPNNHLHHQSIIGGSCSSGTSSSSSSNEHLNSIQSPSGSPITQAKLDISPLKLSSSPTLNEESSSSSNTSSPGPQGSPSPSTLSNLSSSSSSPRSTDGNKDLDHFYFLDEHWKPSSDGSTGMTSGETMDTSSNNTSLWNNSSSGSPSPPTVASGATPLNMMVDQFFTSGGHNSNFGLVDVNNNYISNGDHGIGAGGVVLRDSNNNVIGGQQTDLNEIATRPGGNDRLYNSFSGFNSGNLNGYSNGGASGLFNFGAATKFNGSSTATTVVNVETQIGTFNGQRDLEIRLCFIKGDRQTYKPGFGGNQEQHAAQYPAVLGMSSDQDSKLITVIGDPFKSSSPQDNGESQSSSSDNEMDSAGEPAVIGMPKSKELVQQS